VLAVSAVLAATAADGTPIVEADLDAIGVDEAITDARRLGAAELWTTAASRPGPSFAPAGAFLLLRCDAVPAGEPLAETRDAALIELLMRAGFAGVWGHRLPDPARMAANAASAAVVHLVLDDVALCRVRPATREIDQPALLAHARTPERSARLLLAGCAALGPGPATLESWGEADEVVAAWESLGFRVEERVPGWRLVLDPHRSLASGG